MLRKTLLITSLILSFSSVNTATAANAALEAETSSNMAAAEQQQSALTVTDVWARKCLSCANNNSAAYMQITNNTAKDIEIIGVSAPLIANTVEMHNSFVDEKGVSHMVAIDKILVPGNSSIELAPGGMHIMLLDLKKHINTGDHFPMTLYVKDEDPIKLDVETK